MPGGYGVVHYGRVLVEAGKAAVMTACGELGIVARAWPDVTCAQCLDARLAAEHGARERRRAGEADAPPPAPPRPASRPPAGPPWYCRGCQRRRAAEAGHLCESCGAWMRQ